MEDHFATLKLLDSDSDTKLTRAFSFSELPSSRRLHLAQSYQSGNAPGLVRQYSCEQIFDHDAITRQLKISESILYRKNEHTNEWQTAAPCPDAFKIPDWHLYNSSRVKQKPNSASGEITNDIEYMEIENTETSKEDIPIFDEPLINTNTNTKPTHPSPETEQVDATETKSIGSYEGVKRKLRPLVATISKSPVRKRKNMCCRGLVCLFIIPIVIAIIALFFNPVTYTVCNRSVLFENGIVQLKEKLHGQENAVKSIVHALRNDIDQFKIVCLIGGTGVGKSYTTEIIANNFPRKEKISLHDATIGLEFGKNVINSVGSSELMIVENLKMNNLHGFLQLFNELKKINNKCITIFAIFNVENVNEHLIRNVDLTKSVDEINQASADKLMDISIVSYEPLKESALKMCITDAAAYSNLKLSEDQVNETLQILLSSGSGCKGAYSKVQVIGRG
ncbi:uncharacterized protein LOC143212243 [Lasioglossum baleicum]|uniref:uncharacterized protein LOC143212243 n=1 Tax=Lasioglossum baleicum TaxID=434251 RepID=UPI003FCE46DA